MKKVVILSFLLMIIFTSTAYAGSAVTALYKGDISASSQAITSSVGAYATVTNYSSSCCKVTGKLQQVVGSTYYNRLAVEVDIGEYGSTGWYTTTGTYRVKLVPKVPLLGFAYGTVKNY